MRMIFQLGRGQISLFAQCVAMAASPQSLFLSIQYPQAIGTLSEDKLDALLSSIQQNQAFYEYECSLCTLTTPAGVTVPIDTPSLYCKKAPSYVTTKSDELFPLILVQLTFAVAVSSVEADIITKTVDGLIREHLVPEKSNVSIKILVTSLSGGPSHKASFSAGNGHLPLPYYQVRELTLSRVNHPVVILLAILCLGVLLLNFALQFHFQ